MPPKRTNEHLDSKKAEKAEKRQKLMCGEMENPGGDVEKECPPDLSSPQSTTEMVSLATTMAQLEEYVRAGNQDAVRQLLTHQEINLSTPEGGDLLWTAYALGMTEIAIMLVQYGADLTVRKLSDKRTLLHHILRSPRIQSTVTRNLFSLMLDFGADVNACDNEGKTLLHDAITSSHEGSIELAKELLNHGAQVMDKRKPIKDHVSLACQNKIELLPKLVQHRSVRVRNYRASVAICALIYRQYPDDNTASAALLIMEKILQSDVSVDVSERLQRGKLKMTFLSRALRHKKIAVVQLLLKYGADFHHKNHIGQTCLYQAASFRDTSQVSRWFIERGVSIQVRNDNGDYPIHGACRHQSLKNLHLLINLGADLNSTNVVGQTPFGAMKLKKNRKFIETRQLLIKHLALMLARGEKLNEKDITRINQYDWIKKYFDSCLKQLEEMKVQKVHRNTPYFSLLSKNMYFTMQLMKDKNFIKCFKRDEKRRAHLFPDYCNMLLDCFKIATKRSEVFLEQKEFLHKVFIGPLPDSIITKLAYYLCFEELKHCNHEYFMSFHQKLESGQK